MKKITQIILQYPCLYSRTKSSKLTTLLILLMLTCGYNILAQDYNTAYRNAVVIKNHDLNGDTDLQTSVLGFDMQSLRKSSSVIRKKTGNITKPKNNSIHDTYKVTSLTRISEIDIKSMAVNYRLPVFNEVMTRGRIIVWFREKIQEYKIINEAANSHEIREKRT